MKKLIFAFVFLAASCAPAETPNPDAARWEARAQTIDIVRDDWGIAHIHGPTDADAVFGMIYAQAEDDFNRIEVNFLNSQGRLAEAEGEAEIWRDLRMKLFIDPADMQAMYAEAPVWLQALMDAWADGLNYYLYKHPEVTPKVITRFEPWMALTFSEGSIGGDIERVNLRELETFYGGEGATASADAGHGGTRMAGGVRVRGVDAAPTSGDVLARMAASVEDFSAEPSGSNGFAIAPENTADGHALLWINPHTSFFFREELQMSSDEGLNAYGAVTWGQFFVYQGFNERTGWMHTSSNVDNIDEYLESVTEQADGSHTYRYGEEDRPVMQEQITVPYKTDAGMAERTFTVYRTHHGPVVRTEGDKWVTVRLMEEPLKALQQSYARTKARNLEEFRQSMEFHTNSSNNTVYADADGNIGYFHSNFIPRRDTRFNWDEPVDGSDPATEWGDVLSIDESPNMFNPANGWIQNTNNWPYTVSGSFSPKQSDYAPYVNRGGENPRGVHAIRVLDGVKDFTPQSLIDAAFDSYLPAFADLVPALVRAYDGAPSSDLKTSVAEQVEALRGWDYRWGAESVPTSVAVFWGEQLFRDIGGDARQAGVDIYEYGARRATAAQLLGALAAASTKLTEDFGTWQTPWGDINRFQRLTGDIVQPFNDDGPSIPVAFTSSRWGSLASFGARAYPDTRKWYGTSGNSFVAVVQFGDSVRARAITAGGLNSDPASPHFNDQAQRYADGNLRDVYFYPNQLVGHTERTYHPGG